MSVNKNTKKLISFLKVKSMIQNGVTFWTDLSIHCLDFLVSISAELKDVSFLLPDDFVKICVDMNTTPKSIISEIENPITSSWSSYLLKHAPLHYGKDFMELATKNTGLNMTDLDRIPYIENVISEGLKSLESVIKERTDKTLNSYYISELYLERVKELEKKQRIEPTTVEDTVVSKSLVFWAISKNEAQEVHKNLSDSALNTDYIEKFLIPKQAGNLKATSFLQILVNRLMRCLIVFNGVTKTNAMAIMIEAFHCKGMISALRNFKGFLNKNYPDDPMLSLKGENQLQYKIHLDEVTGGYELRWSADMSINRTCQYSKRDSLEKRNFMIYIYPMAKLLISEIEGKLKFAMKYSDVIYYKDYKNMTLKAENEEFKEVKGKFYLICLMSNMIRHYQKEAKTYKEIYYDVYRLIEKVDFFFSLPSTVYIPEENDLNKEVKELILGEGLGQKVTLRATRLGLLEIIKSLIESDERIEIRNEEDEILHHLYIYFMSGKCKRFNYLRIANLSWSNFIINLSIKGNLSMSIVSLNILRKLIDKTKDSFDNYEKDFKVLSKLIYDSREHLKKVQFLRYDVDTDLIALYPPTNIDKRDIERFKKENLNISKIVEDIQKSIIMTLEQEALEGGSEFFTLNGTRVEIPEDDKFSITQMIMDKRRMKLDISRAEDKISIRKEKIIAFGMMREKNTWKSCDSCLLSIFLGTVSITNVSGLHCTHAERVDLNQLLTISKNFEGDFLSTSTTWKLSQLSIEYPLKISFNGYPSVLIVDKYLNVLGYSSKERSNMDIVCEPIEMSYNHRFFNDIKYNKLTISESWMNLKDKEKIKTTLNIIESLNILFLKNKEEVDEEKFIEDVRKNYEEIKIVHDKIDKIFLETPTFTESKKKVISEDQVGLNFEFLTNKEKIFPIYIMVYTIEAMYCLVNHDTIFDIEFFKGAKGYSKHNDKKGKKHPFWLDVLMLNKFKNIGFTEMLEKKLKQIGFFPICYGELKILVDKKEIYIPNMSTGDMKVLGALKGKIDFIDINKIVNYDKKARIQKRGIGEEFWE